MRLPSPQEYLQIVQTKALGNLATLNHHRFLLKEDGQPYHQTSRNTIVFKTEYNGKLCAVRFFLKDDPDLFRRYSEVENFLRSKSFSWKVPFEFLDKEFYPAVKMDWIDSLSFSEYLDLIISNPSGISQLQSQLISLSRNLEENGVAHGNLNVKHIRFVKQDQEYVLKLIDYDSMFIPAFKEQDSLSVGTPGFQHPMRLASDFSETVDRFSFWVFITALEAFKTDPGLWIKAEEYGYDKTKQILFTYRDLAFPEQSSAFQILKSYNQKPLNFYADKLMQFCNFKSLDKIEAVQVYGVNSSPLKKKEETYQPQKTEAPPQVQPQPAKQWTPAAPVQRTVAETKPILQKEKTVKARAITKDSEFVHLKVQKKEKPSAPAQKNKKVKAIIGIAIAALLVFTSVYFVKQNKAVHSSENNVEQKQETPVPKKVVAPVQQTVAVTPAAFTSARITQFLSQLYQSYNKRDLASILSNYAEEMTQYYDARAVSKDKLSGIINNLFIKPAYYQCRPDFQSVQFSMQGDTCRITVTINETIKPDKRSKKENYSSTIEYTIDRSFKIIAEKNVG